MIQIGYLGIAALGSTAALGAARIRSPLPGYSNTVWLQTGSQIVIALLIPVALWIFWRGHNAPGGGFIAALVVASAVGLAMLCRLVCPTSRQLAVGSHALILSGLSVALLSALLPVFGGRDFFTGLWLHWGDFHLGTPLLFDLGVMLTVLGFATRYLRHFQPNRH
jgi:multisubunit Na+/H+ antiporter MnhB subunit